MESHEAIVVGEALVPFVPAGECELRVCLGEAVPNVADALADFG